MIGTRNSLVSGEDKGRRFLELVDEQNSLQWNMVRNLAKLVKSGWDSPEIKAELESLAKKHEKITRELNGLDDDSNNNNGNGGSDAL